MVVFPWKRTRPNKSARPCTANATHKINSSSSSISSGKNVTFTSYKLLDLVVALLHFLSFLVLFTLLVSFVSSRLVVVLMWRYGSIMRHFPPPSSHPIIHHNRQQKTCDKKHLRRRLVLNHTNHTIGLRHESPRNPATTTR
jgi:hypothetical protein